MAFKCSFDLTTVPTEVTGGQELSTQITVLSSEKPVKFVHFYVPMARFDIKLEKTDKENTFSSTVKVPRGGFGMTLNAMLFAETEEGEKSEPHPLKIKAN